VNPSPVVRWRRLLHRLGHDDGTDHEDGNAIVEFIFVAVLVLVPLVYVVVLFATIQRDQLAVTSAAREAGRAFATATTPEQGMDRAQLAARMAYQDAGLSGPVELTFVGAQAPCGSTSVAPTLRAGAEFAVCVDNHDELPAVPVLLQGRDGLSSEGRFVVHVDDYR
jgi:Flp pilus assembly protein TadG